MMTKTHPTLISDVLTNNFGEVVNEFFNQDRHLKSANILPAVDFIELEKSYKLVASLPGLDKKDIEVKLDGSRLTITAKNQLQLEDGAKLHIQEIRTGSYNRTIKLPRNADTTKIKAEYVNGTLILLIDKKKEDLPKVIEVK